MSENQSDVPINVQEFIESWSNVLPDDVLKRNQFRGPREDDAKLEKICDPKRLLHQRELSRVMNMESLNAPQLFSIDYLSSRFRFGRTRVTSDAGLRINVDEWTKADINSQENKNNEAILVIHVFIPFAQRIRSRPSFNQEIWMLSSQTLTDLRDVIVCPCDDHRIGEFSEDPDKKNDAPMARDKFSASYFYIEGNFFNDFRNTDVDSSRQVVDWIKDYGHETKSHDMSQTPLSALDICIGRPYLYCHLGACEHILLFSDIRMRAVDDIWSADRYPLQLYRSRGRFEFCYICRRLYACWLVKNSSRVLDDPCLMCNLCFRSAHYDDDGTRLDPNFKVYHYSQKC